MKWVLERNLILICFLIWYFANLSIFSFIQNVHLINYWPMSNLSDVVGKANFYSGTNFTLAKNRFCDSNAAIYLNQSYLRAPSGIYLTSDFTVTVWIYLKSYRNKSELISFGNKSSKETFIAFFLYSASQLTVLSHIKNNSHSITAGKLLQLNKWYHVALVLSGANAYVYVNGALVCNGNLHLKNNSNRSINLIGKNTDAIFDELKIYHGPMTANQVLDEYIVSSSNGNISNLVYKYCPAYLINYWPMSNLSDVVGGANLYSGSNYTFVNDRLQRKNEAIAFNMGYLSIPAGVYISGDFTITAWIYIISYRRSFRIIEFGNGKENDNVFLAMNGNSSHFNFYLMIYQNKVSDCPGDKPNCNLFFSYRKVGETSIQLKRWYHVAYVVEEKTALFYINSIKKTHTGYIYEDEKEIITQEIVKPKGVLRKVNYIGRSGWPQDENAHAVYDDIKIYRGALQPTDVENEYSNRE